MDFAAMTEMDMDDAWELYSSDAMAGVHPEDRERVRKAMEKYIAGCDSSYEIVYRIKKGKDGYLWVKIHFPLSKTRVATIGSMPSITI